MTFPLMCQIMWIEQALEKLKADEQSRAQQNLGWQS